MPVKSGLPERKLTPTTTTPRKNLINVKKDTGCFSASEYLLDLPTTNTREEYKDISFNNI